MAIRARSASMHKYNYNIIIIIFIPNKRVLKRKHRSRMLPKHRKAMRFEARSSHSARSKFYIAARLGREPPPLVRLAPWEKSSLKAFCPTPPLLSPRVGLPTHHPLPSFFIISIFYNLPLPFSLFRSFL